MAIKKFIHEFWLFGLKQAWACLFGGILLFFILGTSLYYPDWMPLYRYDFLFFIALLIQACLLLFKLENIEEAKVIFLFHIVGTIMELFKTSVGSWAYPEPSIIKIMDVPLFSGFMYSAVGSYIARAWRIMDMKFDNFPPTKYTTPLLLLIYVNFFTHHYFIDIRYLLFALIFVLFYKTRIYFRADKIYRHMPLLIAMFLTAFFVWLAENIGSFSKIWLYPHQNNGFSMVKMQKLGSWFMLIIISGIMVSFIHKPQKMQH